MIGLEIDNTVIVEQKQILEQALSTNPKTQKALQELIRKVIMEARADVMNSVRFKNGDPREARNAIRSTVYKRILGGNLNILNSRKTHGTNDYEPPRKLRPGQRGGNRRPRSVRTNNVMHYGGYDRGFILRFVNSGTKQRNIEHLVEIKRADGTSKFRWRNDNGAYGNRGAIAARNWFKGASERELVDASAKLDYLIHTELMNILSKTK